MKTLLFYVSFLLIVWAVDESSCQEVWTRCNIPKINTSRLSGVAFGNNTFVCIGYSGTILTSPDGTNWTSQVSGTDQNLGQVIWGNDEFLILEVSNYEIFMTSKDGVSWKFQSFKSDSMPCAVTWGRNRYVAVGELGSTATSPDGVSWTKLNSVTDQFMTGVACDGNQFVAVGTSGKILVSPEAFPWTTIPRVGNGYTLFGMVWGGNRFVAVGYQGTIIASPDGSNWSVSKSGTIIDLLAVNWGDNQYIAVGCKGTIQTSTDDGANWVQRTSGVLSDLNSVAWGNGNFVAVGYDTTILWSPGVTRIRAIAGSKDPEFTIRINKTLVHVVLPVLTRARVKIFSTNGCLVREVAINNYVCGEVILHANISKGTYIVLLTAGKMRIEKKILVD